MRLISNRVQCLKCNDIIESKHRHDYQRCSCDAIMTDGGTDYIRRGGNQEDMLDLSVYIDCTQEDEDIYISYNETLELNNDKDFSLEETALQFSVTVDEVKESLNKFGGKDA